MEITQRPGPQWLEIQLNGRFDTHWAEHVSTAIEDAVRGGAHIIRLNLTQVEFISSLGIRVLMNHYKRLKTVDGRLSVVAPSAAASAVLEAAGLLEYLLDPHGDDKPEPIDSGRSGPEAIERDGMRFELYPQAVEAPLTSTLSGNPAALGAGYSAGDCHAEMFGEGRFGLGLGAFGAGFEDCRERFGEFLAAGGCAITQPTDNTNSLPDYFLEEGELMPQVQMLYGISGSGDFPLMLRFDPAPGSTGAIPLSRFVSHVLDLLAAEHAVFVTLAEARGLVGAHLLRSPVVAPVSYALPAVRDSLSFTTDPSSELCLALIVGVASRNQAGSSAFLRPLGADSELSAHIHAAVFPYRPVQRGQLALTDVVAGILGGSTPTSVMHLMQDSRPFEGVGETDLLRGACWAGALPGLDEPAMEAGQ